MTEIAVIDLETTGQDPTDGHVPVEAAVAFYDPSDAGRCETWESLFCPGRDVDPRASAVHHLTAERLACCPPLPDPSFWVELVSRSDYVAAHNAAFDRSFLPCLARPWICTYRCSLHLWPDAPSHSLQALRYWLKLDPVLPDALQAHRAMYDVMCTVSLIERMRQHPEELLEMTTRPLILARVKFGMHRGELWSDVPRGYLRWVLQQDFDEDVRNTAQHYYDGVLN